VSSNWGNWMYVAGVGADRRTRVFDVADQANRYDRDRRYQELWLDSV
jgi:deoxyribodipyrimidine photo-lyase